MFYFSPIISYFLIIIICRNWYKSRLNCYFFKQSMLNVLQTSKPTGKFYVTIIVGVSTDSFHSAFWFCYSCIHWWHPFFSSTICGHKWSSLFFFLNIQGCRCGKWCFSKLICWTDEFSRYVGYCCLLVLLTTLSFS